MTTLIPCFLKNPFSSAAGTLYQTVFCSYTGFVGREGLGDSEPGLHSAGFETLTSAHSSFTVPGGIDFCGPGLLFPLPAVRLLEDRSGAVACEPFPGLPVACEPGVPECRAKGENGAMMVGVPLLAVAREGAIGEGGVLGVGQDQFVLAAGGKGGKDRQAIVRVRRSR